MSRDDPGRPLGRKPVYDWPRAIDDQLVARFKAGDRVKTIAANMERPLWAVQGRLDRLREMGRIDYRARPWTAAESGRLFAALEAGGGYSRLAPLFRRSRAALRQHAVTARRTREAADAAADRDQLTLELRDS